MKARPFSAAVILLAALVSCAAPTHESAVSAPHAAITRADVDQAIQDLTHALRSGDGAMAAACYAPDAVFINARGRVESRARIDAFWTEAVQTSGAGKNLELELEKWGTSGDLAYSISRFTGGITAPSGRVLTVSQRQADGRLKTVAQVSIPDPPAK